MEVFTTIAKEYGLFVALVAWLLWFFDRLIKENRKEHGEHRKENAEREARYVAVIDRLSESFSDLAIEVQHIKVLMERDRQAEKAKVAK